MKVIIIGPAHPFRGGIADTNESLCRALSANNHEASLITFTLQYPEFLFPGKTQYSSEPKPEDLTITRMINSLNPVNWLLAAKKINKLKPQLVIFRYWIPFLSPALGSLARLLNKEIVKVALCDNVIPHEKHFGDEFLTNYFVNAFDGFVTLSEAVSKELDQFTTKPKMYFPHPINDNLGKKIPQDEARKYLHLNPDGKYLLFFGLIRKYKGLDLLLKAMGENSIRDSGIQLLIVGEFYDDPEEYYQLISDYGITKQVEIRNEFIPTSEIKYYFSAVDLVTQTYHTASQSGVTQIAFNFDCPMLVTNVGGLSETVLHEKVGYVTSKEPADIAKYIAFFFENHRAALFIENVRKEKVKYSWKAFSNELLKLYDEIRKRHLR